MARLTFQRQTQKGKMGFGDEEEHCQISAYSLKRL